MRFSQVSPKKVAMNLRNFFIDFSYTKRDERINTYLYDTNYFLDTNGVLYEKRLRSSDSASVIVAGGDSTFLHQKNKDEETEIYIAPPQIITIKEMMRFLSYSGGKYPNIESPSEYLQNLSLSYYYNFRG